MEKSLRTLLEGLIDYAGLFPPATLDMPAAVRNYAAYRRSAEAAWLGRFVVPVARLEELARAVEAAEAAGGSVQPVASPSPLADPAPGADAVSGPWRLSVLVGKDRAAEYRAIEGFNHAFNRTGASQRPRPLIIDALETKVENVSDAEAALAGRPAGVTAYLEIPIHEDPSDLLVAIAAAGGRAKVRTGGVTADMIPPPEALARFLAACARAGTPFKATAGLHHPVRSQRRLTYAPDSPSARMHGFVNVFLAAAFAAGGMDTKALAALLAEESPEAFRFTGGAAEWRGHVLPENRLAAVRKNFAIAFGSCSFDEPREDLSEAHLL